MAIYIYNRNNEEHLGDNVFPIYRGTPLGNPYTHIKDRTTKAKYIVGSVDEAVDQYSHYFDIMYGSNLEFTNYFDNIYRKYKEGKDIYLECYCNVNEGAKCHGLIIKKNLEKRIIKEKLEEMKHGSNYKQ